VQSGTRRPSRYVTPPPAPELATVAAALEQALSQGRAPRGRRALRVAIGAAVRRGDLVAAARGSDLLARIELRHGNAAAAERPARAALRQARRAGLSLTGPLARLAGIRRERGDAAGALRLAGQAFRAAGDAADRRRALEEVTAAAWAAGDLPGAWRAAERAGAEDAEGGLLLSRVLARVGCVADAEKRLAAALREGSTPEWDVRLFLERGHARVVLGRLDRAARDFRAAARLARECADARWEARATILLAAVENQRALAEGNTARGRRAAALANRAGRLVRRLRDPQLAALRERTAVWPPPVSLPKPPIEAARALRELAQRVDCLTLVDAGIAEVARLQGLAAGEAAYAHEPLPLV